MEWIPVALQVAGTLFKSSGQSQAADAALAAGRAKAVQSRYQEAQLTQNAGQQVAASQRDALDQQRIAKLVASRAIAVAGASGGGVTDPSVAKIVGDITGEGAYRSQIALYQGNERARQMNIAAQGKEMEAQIFEQGGDAQASAFRTDAAGSLLTGAAGVANTLYKKYGGTGAPSAFDSSGIADSGTYANNDWMSA